MAEVIQCLCAVLAGVPAPSLREKEIAGTLLLHSSFLRIKVVQEHCEVGITLAKGPVSGHCGTITPSFGWFGCGHAGTSCDDCCLKLNVGSNCRAGTGSSPMLRFHSHLEALTQEGRSGVPSHRHCAKHFPA